MNGFFVSIFFTVCFFSVNRNLKMNGHIMNLLYLYMIDKTSKQKIDLESKLNFKILFLLSVTDLNNAATFP